MRAQFPNRFEKTGKMKHYKIHARQNGSPVVKQQKGRRIPIQLQENVKKEIKRLLQEGHTVKAESKKTFFYSPWSSR